MPKTYEYQCEAHGPWTDFHSNKRATYDCPTCYMEQQKRYATLYGREVTATHLLQLSLDLSQNETTMRLARNLAMQVASDGLATARGWLNGWWYVSGNIHADNRAAYELMNAILGGV